MKAYTFRDWLAQYKGQGLLFVSVGYWRELGEWPKPGRVFRWHGWLPELWYYVKCRLWRRYNTVTASTMPPTWQDANERLLHISFTILCDVVEKEDILHHCAWTEGEHMQTGSATPIDPQFYNLQEIATLYDWWKNVRPQREDPTDWWVAQCAKEGIERRFTDIEVDPPLGGPEIVGQVTRRVWKTPADEQRNRDILMQSHEMELAQDAEDTEMLHRLIDIRGALWT
jgi:hypothetical protein